MKKTNLNEYQNLIELRNFINKYLDLKLPNFNKNTEVLVKYEEGIYLVALPCFVQGLKVEINWSTYEYLNDNSISILTDIMSVKNLLTIIKDSLDELESHRPVNTSM